MSEPRYAVIHVKPTPTSDAWPIVERTHGGWQSGSHHYPDVDVLDVRPLALVPVPRVWLPGDTVPADVWTRGPDGEVSSHDLDEVIDPGWPEGAYVEVHVPDAAAYTAAVDAARARTRRENALKASESAAVAPAEESASEPREAVSGAPGPVSDPAERLRLAAETLDGDAAGLAAPLAAILRSSAKRAAAELRDFVDPTTPAALAWVRQIHADELAVADVILGATR